MSLPSICFCCRDLPLLCFALVEFESWYVSVEVLCITYVISLVPCPKRRLYRADLAAPEAGLEDGTYGLKG